MTGSSLHTPRTDPNDGPAPDGPEDRIAVARALREIGRLLALEGKEAHRARAYLRAADAIEALGADLRELARIGRLTTVPGIGARLARTVEEILESGSSALLETLRRRYPPGALELGSVLSLPRIRALHEAPGITSLAQLREACAAGSVRGVRGFGAATERRILEAIDAAAKRGDAVLLPEATLQGARFLAYLQQSPIIARAELAGSLRRRVESIDRLDVVIASPEPEPAIAHAVRFPAAPAISEPGATHAELRPRPVFRSTSVPSPRRRSRRQHGYMPPARTCQSPGLTQRRTRGRHRARRGRRAAQMVGISPRGRVRGLSSARPGVHPGRAAGGRRGDQAAAAGALPPIWSRPPTCWARCTAIPSTPTDATRSRRWHALRKRSVCAT
jgi:DNA polymerase/3'-5' exonuclease PolX